MPREPPALATTFEDVAKFPARYHGKTMVFKLAPVDGGTERMNGQFTLPIRSAAKSIFLGDMIPTLRPAMNLSNNQLPFPRVRIITSPTARHTRALEKHTTKPVYRFANLKSTTREEGLRKPFGRQFKRFKFAHSHCGIRNGRNVDSAELTGVNCSPEMKSHSAINVVCGMPIMPNRLTTLQAAIRRIKIALAQPT